MMSIKKKLIFDTSAINLWAVDEDGIVILQSLAFAYHVGIPETVVSEIIADQDEERRSSRLTVLNRLRNYGNCIMPFNWIIEEQAKSWQNNPSDYDWRTLNIIMRALEEELAQQEIMHSLSKDTLDSQIAAENEFAEMFERAKPAFQKIFEAGARRPPVEEVTERLLGEGGAHLAIGAGLIERATKKRPTDAETKKFVDDCPPFRALLVALCVAQYDRCIRGEGAPWIGKAGRTDMFSAVYLPYCKLYVTRDSGQAKALRKVAQLAGLNVAIEACDSFKEQLFGIASEPAQR